MISRFGGASLLLLALAGHLSAEIDVRSRSAHRSPVDLVLAPDGSWLATANQTSHTVSLVDTEHGKVLSEVEVGRYPVTVLRDRSGERLLVACRDAGEIHILKVADGKLLLDRAIKVGFHPHGMAFSPDEKQLYVALTAANQVAVVDVESGEITMRIETGRWPRYMALSLDGKRLAVGASGDRGVSVIDCQSQTLAFHESFVGLNIGHLAIGGDGKVYFPWMVYRSNPITAGNIRLGWVLASRVGRMRLDAAARREAFSLDPPGKAIADVHGLALTKDDTRLVVSASGTHELLVYRLDGLPFKDYGGTDHVDPALLADEQRFARVEMGGRPMGLRLSDDGRTAYVANYLRSSVQVVDLQTRKVVSEITLGGPIEDSLARQGEAIFYDARRSLDQWYSCHTCHYEGGTSSERMDTLNDGTRGTPKTVLSLYHFEHTAPWTWHGWQTDRRAAMRKSLTETMLGPPPSGEDIDALLAYFAELKPPPNPYRNDPARREAVERGRRIFESEKAGCANCHNGPHFTDGEIHDVGLGASGDAYQGFNTPSLVDVYSRVRLLHDGRAKSLEEVLTGAHDPAKVTGKGALSADELRDLIEYLKTL